MKAPMTMSRTSDVVNSVAQKRDSASSVYTAYRTQHSPHSPLTSSTPFDFVGSFFHRSLCPTPINQAVTASTISNQSRGRAPPCCRRFIRPTRAASCGAHRFSRCYSHPCPRATSTCSMTADSSGWQS